MAAGETHAGWTKAGETERERERGERSSRRKKNLK